VTRGNRCIARVGLLAGALSWAAPAAAQTTCAEPVSVERLETFVAEAESAFEDLQEDHFLHLMKATLPPALPCLDAPIPPALAARYHWLVAMHNLAPDEDAAFQAVLAAHALAEHDDRRLLEGLPEDGDAWRLYRSVPPERVRHTLSAPDTGAIHFDGVETLDRPIDQFTIVQYTDAAGAVTKTRYVLLDQVLDPYPGAKTRDLRPARELAAGVAARGFDPSKPAFKGTLIGAGAVGVAAGVFYGLAIASKARFEDDTQAATLDELQALQARTNALGATADGLAITAGVGVGAAFLVGAF
jgi:hypothetical protein